MVDLGEVVVDVACARPVSVFCLVATKKECVSMDENG